MKQLAVNPKHTNRENYRIIGEFFSQCDLREEDILKFEARRGDMPTFHLVNHAFIKLAPTNTTWVEQVGCGGNVHRSVVIMGVRLVSVFRRVEECV